MAHYSVCFYHQWALLVPTKLAPYSRIRDPGATYLTTAALL